jgi:hypothetical protein
MRILFFFLTLISTKLMAQNHLTLYFVPSPKGMDWSSPANLAWSAIKNKVSMKSRFMGHVFVEFQCGDKREITGMVGKNFDYLTQLIIHGRGLGILFHSFDGELERQAEIDAELADYFKTGYVNFSRFLLNDGQCKRIGEYLQVYREKNVGRYYGLANRPRYGEGSGCSAFGASFLDVAGLLDQEITDAWSHSVNIPMKYAGPPLRDESVNLLSLMWNASSWAAEKDEHKKIFFWDPDRMFKWTNERIKAKDPRYKVLAIEKTQGLLIDKSHLPAPLGPIWLQHLEMKTSEK